MVSKTHSTHAIVQEGRGDINSIDTTQAKRRDSTTKPERPGAKGQHQGHDRARRGETATILRARELRAASAWKGRLNRKGPRWPRREQTAGATETGQAD